MYSDCAGTRIQRPLLGVEKSLRSLAAEPGREAQFEIVITNLSAVTAYTVTIEDDMPAGFIYVEDSARSLDTVLIDLGDVQPLVWVLDNLEPQQSIRLTYSVFVDPTVPDDVYTTTVKVHAMDRAGFPFDSNEFIYDFGVERALLIDVTQRLAEPAGTVSILSGGNTFVVQTDLDNVGSEGLQEGVLLVTLPAEARYVPGSSTLNNTALPDPILDGAQWRWNLSDLPAKGKMTLQYSLRSTELLQEEAKIQTRLLGISSTGQAYESRLYRFDLK